MVVTIDEIINITKEDYQLNVTDTNRCAISTFLEWFLRSNPYDFSTGRKFNGHTPAFWLMTDAVLIYSYLQGERSVREDLYTDKTTFIESRDQLPLLRSRGGQQAQWPDNNVYTLFLRRDRNAAAHSLPGYQGLFDLVSAYPLLIERWGKQLHYAQDVVVKRGGKYLNKVVR